MKKRQGEETLDFLVGSSGVTTQLDGLTVVAPLFLPFVGLIAIKFFRCLDLKFELYATFFLQLWCEMIEVTLLVNNYFDIEMKRFNTYLIEAYENKNCL